MAYVPPDERDNFQQEYLPTSVPLGLPFSQNPNGITLDHGQLTSFNYAKDKRGWRLGANGEIEFTLLQKTGNVTKDTTTTTTTTIAHGLGRLPKFVQVYATQPTNGNITYGSYDGTNTQMISNVGNFTAVDTTNVVILYANSGNYIAGVMTWDAVNLTIIWTKTGTPGGNGTFIWTAI